MWRLCFLLPALLAGCTTVTTETTSAPPRVQAFLPSFEINGRLSVRHQEEGFSGNLHWRHVDDADEFVVLTPLGQSVARVTQNSQGATLQTGDGQNLEARDAESLTQQVLGFRLPLAGLPRWVQALSVREDAAKRHNEDGTLGELQEQGWQIEYQSYQQVGDSLLPSKLSMKNADLKLRLVIDDWQAPAP